jgi:hypothetical protein
MSLSIDTSHRDVPLFEETQMYAAMNTAITGAADFPGIDIASLAVGR